MFFFNRFANVQMNLSNKVELVPSYLNDHLDYHPNHNLSLNGIKLMVSWRLRVYRSCEVLKYPVWKIRDYSSITTQTKDYMVSFLDGLVVNRVILPKCYGYRMGLNPHYTSSIPFIC